MTVHPIPAPSSMRSSCNAPGGTSMGDELVVVDLEGSGAVRPLLLALARNAVRTARRRARGRTAGSSVVVLYHGDAGRELKAGQGVVTTTADALTQEAWKECQHWIDQVSRQVVFGSGRERFPEVNGVHLGELLRLPVQAHLLDFAYLARALIATIEDREVMCCRIVSGDPDRAAALAELVGGFGVSVRTRSMPLVGALRRLSRVAGSLKSRARERALRNAASPADATLKSLRNRQPIDVLEISESTPMDQMFASMEERFEAAGVSNVVRVQFGGRGGVQRMIGRATVLELGRPGIVPVRKRGHFRAHLNRTGGHSQRIAIAGELGGISVRAPLSALLSVFVYEELDRLSEHLQFAEAVLDASAPRLLVVGNDRWWVGQAFVQLARRRGIPSLCIQDGLASDLVYWWWSAADDFAASAPLLADVLVRHGMPPDSVSVVGQPRYDRLSAMRDRAGLPGLRAGVGLMPERTYVMFATQPHHDIQYAGRVLEAILQVPNVHVILRPHPTEPPDKYASLAEVDASRVSLHADGDIFALLACADLLVTEYSTVVLEGAVLGKAAITANFDGQPARGTYAQRGLAISARSPAELTRAVRRLTSGELTSEELERREAGLQALLGPVDGNSSRRSAELVAEILSRSASSA